MESIVDRTSILLLLSLFLVFLVQEFLAFSSQPVTLEDILRVQGRGVEGKGITLPTITQPSVNTSVDTSRSVRVEKEQGESHQKVVFLSTWTTHNKASQASVKVITDTSKLHNNVDSTCNNASGIGHIVHSE